MVYQLSGCLARPFSIELRVDFVFDSLHKLLKTTASLYYVLPVHYYFLGKSVSIDFYKKTSHQTLSQGPPKSQAPKGVGAALVLAVEMAGISKKVAFLSSSWVYSPVDIKYILKVYFKI